MSSQDGALAFSLTLKLVEQLFDHNHRILALQRYVSLFDTPTLLISDPASPKREDPVPPILPW